MGKLKLFKGTKETTIPDSVRALIRMRALRDPSDPHIEARLIAHYRQGILDTSDMLTPSETKGA